MTFNTTNKFMFIRGRKLIRDMYGVQVSDKSGCVESVIHFEMVDGVANCLISVTTDSMTLWLCH